MLDGTHTLEGGFAAPVFDAQATFRAVMDAMARPATVISLTSRTSPPAPLTPIAGAIALTLVDADTPIWLDSLIGASDAVREWLGFHTGAKFVTVPADAVFGIVGDACTMPPLHDFAQGTQEYPDRSATLILDIAAFHGGAPRTFRGPGIDREATIAPLGLAEGFFRDWAANTRRFPRGVDVILAAGDALACLPRSARLVEG